MFGSYSCSICSDLIDCSSVISATPCGHTFHDRCLLKWLKQSRSCPTCRLPANRQTVIKKLFFNTSDDSFDANGDDISSLKNQITELKNEISIGKKQIGDLNVDKSELEFSLGFTVESVSKLQRENAKLNEKIDDFKCQLSVMKKQCKEYVSVKSKCETLQEQIKLFENIKLAINGSVDEVNTMLTSYTTLQDVKNLATLCTMLKSQLHNMIDQKKKFKENLDHLRRINGEVVKEVTNLKARNQSLAEELLYCERDKASLENKIKKSQHSFSCDANDSPPVHWTNKKRRLDDDDSFFVKPTPSPVSKIKSRITSAPKESDSRIPVKDVSNLPTELSKFGLFKKSRVKTGLTENFMTTYKPKVAEEKSFSGFSQGYNGLGGHETYVEPKMNAWLVAKIQSNKVMRSYFEN